MAHYYNNNSYVFYFSLTHPLNKEYSIVTVEEPDTTLASSALLKGGAVYNSGLKKEEKQKFQEHFFRKKKETTVVAPKLNVNKDVPYIINKSQYVTKVERVIKLKDTVSIKDEPIIKTQKQEITINGPILMKDKHLILKKTPGFINTEDAVINEEDPVLRDEDITDENGRVGLLLASKALVQLVMNPLIGALTSHVGYHLPLFIGSVNLLAAALREFFF